MLLRPLSLMRIGQIYKDRLIKFGHSATISSTEKDMRIHSDQDRGYRQEELSMGLLTKFCDPYLQK